MKKGKAKKFTVDEVVDAVRSANGFLTIAAKKLGCTVQTVQNYRREYPEVVAACNEANEKNVRFMRIANVSVNG
jgi:hypothetical protein